MARRPLLRAMGAALRSRATPPTLVALAFFLLLAVRAGAGDGFRFFHAIQVGETFARPALLLPGQAPQKGVGYDGQFYFFIGQDPFLRNRQIAPALDNSLRYRRILYPFLAWALSLGHRAWLPYSLIAVNVLACTATIAAGALAALRAGRTPWLALVIAIYPGLWIPLLLDLTEPLQLALLAWGMLLSSAGLLFLSALAKETTAVVIGVEFLREVARRRWASSGRHLLAGALLVAWSLFVWKTVPAHESTLGGHLLDPPGAPFIVLARFLREPVQAIFEATAVLICLLSIARLSWARDAAAWSAAAYALVGLAAGVDTWADPAAYFRVIAGSIVLVFLSWVRAGDRAGLITLTLGVFSGAATLPLIAL
jgi:hypothetical protein